MTLQEYIEQQILPRYAAFDKGHQRDHAESVIQESMVLAKEHGADLDMAYTIAAFHDLGLEVNRELHHIHSGEILMADTVLPQFFTDEQREIMRDAVEDHRASSKHAPRTIYGAIVAEADRHIDPETILRRALQFGIKQNPDADFEWHFNRAYEHMLEKYAKGGYMRLWLNSKRNIEGLTKLREIIGDKEYMKTICERIFQTLQIMSKIAFITGASSGIGAACARKFAQGGYTLILNARSVDKLEALKTELETTYGTDVVLLPFDVRDRKAAEEAITTLPEQYQAIDVLVNNAGLALGMDKEYAGVEEDYDTMIDTNITALLMITRMVVPGMIARGRGHIINIGSVAGDAAYPGGSVYCATKAAVKVLSDGLRMDLVDTPLRVTNVKPGLVETNFSVTRFGGDKERADKVYQGIKPLTGEDIADVVYYAASAPAHVQIAEVLVLATHQASGSLVYRR